MKQEELPFGDFDSELMHQEISIPEGFEATIEGNKIILKKTEGDDERIREYLIRYIDNTMKSSELKSKLLAWLEKQKPIQNINKEDEEVRQYIIRIMEQRDINVPMVQNALTWLEKQGESYTKRDVDDAWLKGMCDAKRELEKQSDSPIKWNKNTEGNKPQVNHSVLMKTTHGIAEGEWQGEYWLQYRWAGIVRDSDVLSWMELSDLDKQGEQKPAWSCEDETRLQACLDTLQANSLMGKVDTVMTSWLKSLKQRIKGE